MRRLFVVRSRAALLAGMLMLLAACVSAPPQRVPPPSTPPGQPLPPVIPRAEPRSAKGNPPFYEVFGKRYFVLASAEGYAERGVASWYGPGFHEGSTSNGERYDMHAMTAAHKTLPLPSYVQVTNLSNGRSVVVRVNDRGPFKDGRIIDLSHAAASQLDMIRAGTTFVEVRALTPGDATPSTTPAPQSLYVQAGSFTSEGNARRMVEKLRASGVAQGFVREHAAEGKRLFRVHVGPVSSVAAFDQLLSRLKSLGLGDARLAF